MPASPQAPESAGIRLTQAHCKDLQCPPERAFVRLWDLHGLRLYLQAGRKRKSWYVAGWRKGKTYLNEAEAEVVDFPYAVDRKSVV